MITREEVQPAWEKIVETGFFNYELLTKDQKIWFNIEALTSGGIIDHYINFGAEHNEDAISALEYLGFYDISELIRTINSLFADGQPPNDIEERNKQWDGFSEINELLLEKVDKQFFERSTEIEYELLKHIHTTGIGII